MRPQCAFRSPFIDASRMTPDVRRVVTDTGDGGLKTTREWEEFILAASVSWHVFQESQSRGVREIREGSDEDGSSNNSGLYLPDEPSLFKFAEPQAFGGVLFETEDFPVEPGEEEDIKQVQRQELYELQSVVTACLLSQFARIRSGQWSTCGSQSPALDLHLMLYSAGYEAWRTR